MKLLLLVVIIFGYYVTIQANGKCARPALKRSKVYIYSPFGNVPVKINRCLYNGTYDAYSDVSDNCAKAFQSEVFIDKWGDEHMLEDTGCPIILKEYVSKADLVNNEVSLRSGYTCKYDRGFCYDPTETNTYAVVWEILERSKQECANELFKVFEGDVDIWEFKPQDLSYAFFYDLNFDDAFYLSLDEKKKCQDSEVWYTKNGYIISLKPLVSKDMEIKAALKSPYKTKGIKGVKGGRITSLQSSRSYFSLRPKAVVVQDILKNCDVKSLTIEEIGEVVTSDYLDNPHNLHIILKRYYNLILETKTQLIGIIKEESALNVTEELKQQLDALSTLFEKTRLEILAIQQTLQEAGDLKGIRVDVDKLAIQLVELLKKNEEYDETIKKIWAALYKTSDDANLTNQELKSLGDKIVNLQNSLDNKIVEYITKSEVYDRINQVEQDFHKKLKHLVMNVTLLILNQYSGTGDGVMGKGRQIAQIEELILEKLNSFNVKQLQSAVDGLRDKVNLLLSQTKTESYNNITSLEERLLKKIADLYAQNAPIVPRLDQYEHQLNNFPLTIKDLKLDIEHAKEQTEGIDKNIQTKITEIFEKFGDYEKIINQLKQDLFDLSNKDVDFGPVYEKVKILIEEALKPREQRLSTLESINVQLTEEIRNSAEDIDNLENQIKDILDSFKKWDSWKENVSDNFTKEVEGVKNKIADSNAALDDHSKKQTGFDKSLQDAKDAFKIDLDQLSKLLKESAENINITDVKNNELINKMKDEDEKIYSEIGDIKKDLTNQATSLSNLEELVKEKVDLFESENIKSNELIDSLDNNVTDLYEIIKKQEDSILELRKNSETQQTEIHSLKGDLAMAAKSLQSQDDRIFHLEKKIEKLIAKVIDGEEILLADIKAVNNKVIDTHSEIVYVEEELKALISKCCSSLNFKSGYSGGKSSYTGAKSSYTGVKSSYTGVKH